jgi:hypothetical protein
MNGCQYFCRDRCLTFPTALKTIVYFGIFFVVAKAVKSSSEELNADDAKIEALLNNKDTTS